MSSQLFCLADSPPTLKEDNKTILSVDGDDEDDAVLL
jgi:hypothetical protein